MNKIPKLDMDAIAKVRAHIEGIMDSFQDISLEPEIKNHIELLEFVDEHKNLLCTLHVWGLTAKLITLRAAIAQEMLADNPDKELVREIYDHVDKNADELKAVIDTVRKSRRMVN